MKNIRNITVMAHVDAGKTTITERILMYSGKIHKMGEVHDGTTTTDDDPREQKRGITINAAAVSFNWNTNNISHKINLIDSPGHIDFSIEVERSLRISDGSVCVLDGSQGVEPQTEQVWRQADRYNVARVIFINKLDKLGANFQMSLSSIKEKLGVCAIPIQIPVGEENNFSGIIDLIEMKFISFDDKSFGKQFIVSEVPAELLEEAKNHRVKMIEMLSDFDNIICEKFLAEQTDLITKNEIRNALRVGCISRILFPVVCGSALRNKGIQQLLDAVACYLPAPEDLQQVTGIHPRTKEEVSRSLNKDGPLSALAFKIVSDRNGNLTFVRIYSGVLRTGTYVYNATRGTSERVSNILLMHASSGEPIDFAEAGAIVALKGLKKTYTGDSICDEKNQIVLEQIDFPEPVVELSVEPKTNADQDKLSNGLGKLLLEDPSLKVTTDEDTGQTILKGMGELHLEIVVDKLRNDHGVGVNTGKPKVSYRETITKTGYADHLHKAQNGGKGVYGHAVIDVKPGARGSGFVFNNAVVGGAVPKEFVPSIEKGIKNAMQRGVVSGNPMVDVEVTLVDGSTHSVDGCSYGFELAGSKAFQEAALAANPVILEPIMNVEVTAPDQFMGSVIGVISGRSGQVKNTSFRGNARIIEADMPLRRLFGFTGELRGETQGRAVPSVRFSHYEVCPLKHTELK